MLKAFLLLLAQRDTDATMGSMPPPGPTGTPADFKAWMQQRIEFTKDWYYLYLRILDNEGDWPSPPATASLPDLAKVPALAPVMQNLGPLVQGLLKLIPGPAGAIASAAVPALTGLLNPGGPPSQTPAVAAPVK